MQDPADAGPMALAFRIYRSARPTPSLAMRLLDPPAPEPAPIVVAPPPVAAPIVVAPAAVPVAVESEPTSGPFDHTILAILATEVIGEPLRLAFDRKERELAALFAGLTSAHAIALHARFAEGGRADDPCASAFARMTGERRTRLTNLLASRRVDRGPR